MPQLIESPEPRTTRRWRNYALAGVLVASLAAGPFVIRFHDAAAETAPTPQTAGALPSLAPLVK